MPSFLQVFLITMAALLGAAAIVHAVARFGPRALADAICRPPLLDLAITYFIIAPMVAGPIYAGWTGFGSAIAGQVASVLIWGWIHEAFHPKARRGPRIVKSINGIVGRFRNHAAVWTTALVVPLFWFVRVAQVFVWPPITWLVQLPKYRSSEWVVVSRQKFSGLVGHDLIWCLYCDWMTGVWSLGTEMLRNVESFWCPIRFASGKKCDNCKIDFPDVATDWVPADGTMAQVAALVEAKHSTVPRAWFGHPVRVTIRGEEAEAR